MRSATSFFDKTLFRSQLKHTWPLWLGYTALWLFLVPVMLFSELSAYQGGYSAADASYLLLNTGVRGGIFISFFFGLFFAMLAFSHLTQSRATNGFHALPVRRETIFLTAYLTGLFCQLSTILVTFLLGAAVSAPLHLSFWSVTGAAMGSAMLEAVFFYSFAVQEYQYVSPISFWLELYFESTNEKGRPEVYTLGPNVNNSTPNTLQVLSELLPELKSNIVTPPSDDGIHTLPATEDVSTEESVN